MKKIAFALLTIFSIFAISCEIGLGASVDTDPPSLTISNPPVDAIIRDDFAISGTWSDDGTIGSISVELSRTDGNGEKLTFTGTFAEDSRKGGSGTWAADIPAKTTSIIDGTYQAVVTIKDATGRTTIQNTTFTIDNTAPILILQRPATDISTTDESSIDTFGKVLSLEGRAADDNNIDHIDVKIYSDAGKTNLLDTITLKNVPLSIALDAAKWGDEAYNRIYGTTVGEKQRYYCSIEAYDSAQRYPADGSEQSASDKNGNCAVNFYLYNEVANSSIADLKVTELYSVLNGTNSRAAVDSNVVKTTLNQLKKSTGTFFLNPLNNPTYKLAGYNSTEVFTTYENSSITLDVEPGLDGYPIQKNTLKVYLIKVDSNGEPETGDKIFPDDVTINGASSYKITVKIDRNRAKDINGDEVHYQYGNYIVCVEGKDSQPAQANDLIPENLPLSALGYPISISNSGEAPSLTVNYNVNGTNTTDSIIYLPKKKMNSSEDSDIILSGTITDSSEALQDFTVKVDGVSIGISASNLVPRTGSQGVYDFSGIVIDKTKFNSFYASDQHSIVVTASNGAETTDKRTIMYDIDGPVIEIRNVTPEAYVYSEDGTASSTKYLNGNISISVSFTDGFSSVQTDPDKPIPLPKIEFIQGSNEIPITSDGEITTLSFTKNNISTTSLDNSEVKIRVTAYDRAGNKSVEERTYTVDQDTDKPYVVVAENYAKRTINNLYADISGTDTNRKNVFNKNDTLRLKFIDDDNLASYTAYYKKINSASEITNLTKTSTGVQSISEDIDSGKEYPFTFQLPSDHGFYAVWIDVEDVNGNVRCIPERSSGEETPFYIQVAADAPVITLSNTTWVTTNTANILSTAVKKVLVGINIDSTEGPFVVTRAGYGTTDAEPTSATEFIKGANNSNITSVTLPVNATNVDVTDYFIPTETTNGTYKIKYFVEDKNRRSSGQSVTYKIDNTRPVVTISSSAPTIYDSSNTFRGSITESDSGVNKVQVTFKNPTATGFNEETDIKDANGTSSWYYDADFGEGTTDDPGLNLTEGPNTFYVRAIDNVGNIGEWVSQSFTYDKAAPVIETKVNNEELSVATTQVKTSAYTFKYKVTESYGIATNGEIVTITKNEVAVPSANVSISEADGWKTVDIIGTSSGDGTYKYSISVTDKATKNTTVERNIKLDTVAPVIEVTTPDFSSYQNSSSINVRGTCEDDSGTYAVWYMVKNSGEAAPVPPAANTKTDASWTGWIKTTGTSSWYASGVSGVEGTIKKLYIAAVDNNGIVTASDAVVVKDIKIDLYNPTFTETGIGEGKAYKNAAYTFSGTASDSGSGIKSITISDGTNTYAWYNDSAIGTSTENFSYNNTTGVWSFTVPVTSATENQYDYTLTATDGADKTTTLSRTVVYDKTKPVIAPITAGSWYKTRTITITPTVTDYKTGSTTEDGSGIDVVEATIDASTASSRTWIDVPLSNGNYKGTIDFISDGSKTIYIRAKDRAGNTSLEREVSVNIDTSDPDLEKLKYNVGSTSLKDIGGTVYINASNGITVYGSYSDDNSGVETLVFEGTKKNSNDEFIQPTVTYSTESLDDTDEDKDEVNELSYSAYDSDNATSIKYWKAEFANNILETARLSVTGKNIAGGSKTVSLFMVNKDETRPKFSRPKIEPDTEERIVYQDATSHIYYLNNALQKFTISGLAEDNTSVDKVYIKIENVNASGTVISTSRVIEDNNASGFFDNIEFKQANGTVWTGGAKVTITTTDIAGNSTADIDPQTNNNTNTVLNIVFDTQGPNGVHLMDKSTVKDENGATVAAPKDLYFRIGDQSRDDYVVKDAIEEVVLDDDGNGTAVSDGTAQDGTVTSGVPAWAEKDKDVGGKYSGNTYGNAETVKLRGKFEDKVSSTTNAATGSGVNLIYYKIFTSQPSDSNNYASSFLANYKTQADGYFSLLKTPETRRVFYTDDSTGTDEGKLGGTFTPENGGTVTVTKGSDTKKKYYSDITTNYKTTIANLSAGENYLVLVAVDNVGNAALEGVEYNGETYNDYRINVDYESPTISSDAPAIGEFTNASTPLTLTGSVADNPSSNNAGIKSVWLKYDETKAHWIKANVDESAGTWTATVPVATLNSLYGSSTSPVSKLFTATATDNSGKGNTFSCNLTVTIDKTPPTVEVSVAEKSNAGTNEADVAYVNGSIKIKGTASDTNGLKENESIKLYYTTDAGEKNGLTTLSKWTETTATIDSNNEWTLNTAASPFVDGTTYYFTVAAVDKAGNTGYATPLALAVNEDSDRPTVKFYMNFGDDVNAISLDKTELDGVISDDDGTPHADKVWYYISYDTKNASGTIVSGDIAPANNAWIPYNSSNTTIFKYNATTGSFTFKPNDGTAYIWLKIQDNGGGEFISSNSTTYNFNTLVISDQTGDKVLGSKPSTGTTVEAVPRLKLKKDTIAPLTDSFAYLAKGMDSTKEAQANNGNGWSSNTGSAVFGGTEANTFKVRIYAYDANGISNVKFKLPMNENDPAAKKATAIQDEDDATKSYYEYALTSQGVSKQKEINNNTYDLYWSGDIDVTGLVSGQRSCIIDVSDGTKHKTEPISFVIDNTAPTATVTSHNRNDQVGASFLLKGSFEDGDANQTLKYYLATDSAAPDKDDDLWDNKEEVKGVTAISWSVYFDGASSDSETTHDKLPKQIVAELVDNVIIATSGDNINKAVYETAVTGHAAGSLYRNIETVYFHLLAIDSIGNRGVSTFALKMDPQGDIPTIKMSYPAYPIKEENKNYLDGTTVEYAKLNGIIRAQGSAEDDKNIVGIYMQIDPAYVHANGFDDNNWSTKECPGKTSTKTSLSDFYTVEDMYTSYNTYQTEHNLTGSKTGGPLGIKVGTSPSWNISLNKDGEFNESGDNNFIAIRFFAVDEDGNISDWTDDDLFIISVDSNAPKIGSSEPLYLYQYGFKDSTGTVYYATSATPQNGAQLYSDSGCRTAATGKTYSSSYTAAIVSQQYQDDMWLNGEWWLSGSVEDESGISVLNIREMQSDGTYGDYQDIKASSTSKTFTAAATSGYVINYRVGSIDTNPGYGKLEYTIYAKDELDDDGKDTEAEIKLKYDNKSPTLAASGDDDYSIPVDVVNDQGSYKIQSVVTELKDESGFDKVIFYFKRGSTVYDSYMPKSISGISSGLINDSNIYWKTNTVTAVSGNVITVTADTNIHVGGLVKVGGVIYTITGMNTAGTEITLNGNPASSVNGSQALFAIGHVVDHVGTETEGTKGGKITATAQNPTPYGLGYYGDIPDDDGDLMLEKVSTASTKTLWYGLINSRNIPDGAIEIHYVAFDKAGNMAHGQVTNAFVKNNGPRLASLRVWTDYNGNTQEDAGESESKYYTAKERKIGGNRVERATKVTDNFIVSGNDEDWTSTGTNAATPLMRVTDQTKFYPEIVGGNGDLYYSYRIGAGANQSTWTTTGNSGTTAFAFGNRAGYVEYSDESSVYTVEDDNHESYVNGTSSAFIPISTTMLNGLGNGLKWFEYTIWDSTGDDTPFNEDGSANVTTLSAKFTVLLNVAYADTTAPKAVISPFFWKSKSENSLYGNSKDNGHIELENDLTGTIAEELYGSDPKVSGKITIRGTAYDDIRLSQLWVKFEDITFNNALTGTNPDISNRTGYKLAATYDLEHGRWNVAGATMESNSWEFTATDQYCNKDGHLVDWELSVDTAKVSGNAVCNKNVYIMAVDQRGTGTNHYSSATAAGSESDGVTVYNKPSYQMDIVPYITDIVTSVRTGGGLKSNNIRSASGKYSILSNNSDNKITVKGFNFCTANTMLVAYITSVNPNTSSVSPYGKTLLSNETNVTTTEKTIRKLTIKANSTSEAVITNTGIDKSGYLELFSDGVRALNNINKNDAYGTATKKINSVDTQITGANAAVTDYENSYNREPDYYTTKNVQLTDDRYFRFFDMKDTGVKNGYYPVMIMNGNNPVFGYVNKSGGTSGTPTATGTDSYAGTYEPSHAMPQRSEFNGLDATKVYTEYLIKASTWDQMGMAVDEGGRYYNVSVYNRDGAAMSLVYDRYAEIETSPQGLGWGAGTGYSNYPAAGSYSNNLGNNAITLENVKYGNTLLTERYQYPKLITKGNSITGDATVYMTYYDDGTGEIIFRDFLVGTTVGDTTSEAAIAYKFDSDGSGNQKYYYTCRKTDNSLNGKYVKIGEDYYQLSWSDRYSEYYISTNAGGVFNSKIYNKNGNTYEEFTESISSQLNNTGKDSNNTTYAQKTNLAENIDNSTMYDVGRLSVVTTGSKYFDMGVTNDNHVVIAYVDSSTNKLVLKYSTNAVTGANPTTNVAWTTSSVSFPENIGTYVSLAVDGNAVHISAFDSYDSNLVYMYLPNYNSAEGYKEITVDQASAVGNWTQIKVKDGVPYIAYYNSTENGGRDGIKLAYPVAANGKTAVQNKENPGVDVKPGTAYSASDVNKAATGYTTGAWEYMTVPAITPPQGGDPKFQNVCLGFDSAGKPVVGYLGTNLEFGKWLDE